MGWRLLQPSQEIGERDGLPGRSWAPRVRMATPLPNKTISGECGMPGEKRRQCSESVKARQRDEDQAAPQEGKRRYHDTTPQVTPIFLFHPRRNEPFTICLAASSPRLTLKKKPDPFRQMPAVKSGTAPGICCEPRKASG